jgi:tRNA (guanine-N7-)-methyltransferase
MTTAITPEASASSDGLAPTIRTFHPRRGRLTARHRESLAHLLPKYGFVVTERPLVLEIGSGMGEAALAMAAADPGRDYLAVEIHTPGVANLLAAVEERGLTNVRVVVGDALELLRDRIPPARLDAIHVYFPDPWPKARHHKRRLVQPAHVALLASRLAPGGRLHCATDDAGYAAAMLATLTASSLVNCFESYAPRDERRPLTKFEQRAREAGRDVFDLVFRRP